MKAQQTQSIAKCVVAEAMEKYSALVNRQQAQVIANKHVVVEAVGKLKSMKDFAGVQEFAAERHAVLISMHHIWPKLLMMQF